MLVPLVRSVVGEERIVGEERLRLWSIVGGSDVIVDVAGVMCCGLSYRYAYRSDEMEDASVRRVPNCSM